MTISARYENGVFRPLQDVLITEGAIVEVYLPPDKQETDRPETTGSIANASFAGMWKDRHDLVDGVEYVNRLRGDLHG